MGYYSIFGKVTDFIIDMNISNEIVMGILLDVKVCLDLSTDCDGIDKNKFSKLLYEVVDEDGFALISVLLDEIYSVNDIEDGNEKIFC